MKQALLAIVLVPAVLTAPASAYFKNRREVPAPPYGTWVYVTECTQGQFGEICWEIKDFVDAVDEPKTTTTEMTVTVERPNAPKYDREGEKLSKGFGDFAGSK